MLPSLLHRIRNRASALLIVLNLIIDASLSEMDYVDIIWKALELTAGVALLAALYLGTFYLVTGILSVFAEFFTKVSYPLIKLLLSDNEVAQLSEKRKKLLKFGKILLVGMESYIYSY